MMTRRSDNSKCIRREVSYPMLQNGFSEMKMDESNRRVRQKKITFLEELVHLHELLCILLARRWRGGGLYVLNIALRKS